MSAASRVLNARDAAQPAPGPTGSRNRSGRSRPRGRARRWSPGWLLFFVGPATVLYGVVIVYPMVTAFAYSFFRWTGVRRDDFAGFANYGVLFERFPYNEQLVTAFVHNCLIFVGSMAFEVTAGLFLALLLQRVRLFKRLFQTLYSLPYLMSPLIIGYLWSLVLAPQFGAVNTLFDAVGLDALSRAWLGDPKTALLTVILIGSWQWVGVPMLIFGAALGGIPAEYHEAAKLDGAGALRTLWSITLPLLVPALGVVTVLVFVGSFNTFDLVFATSGSSGSPGGATDVLGLLFYRVAFGGLGGARDVNSIGLSSALAVMLFVFVLVVALLITRLQRSREVDLT